MSWRLRTSPGLAGRLAAGGEAGLLVGALDGSSQTAAVVGCVPVAAGAFKQAAAEVSELLPQGLSVVGSYAAGSKPPWKAQSPSVAATGSGSGSPSWTVDGHQAAAVDEAAAEVADGGDALQLGGLVPGFVALRCHLDVQLAVQYEQQSAAAGAAAGSSSNGAAPAPGGPPPAAVEAAFAQLEQSLLTDQLAFAREAMAPTDEQQAAQPPALVAAGSAGTAQQLLGGAHAPCASLLPLQHTGGRGGKGSAPLFEFDPAQPQPQQLARVPLALDVLAFAPEGAAASELPGALLLPALRQQLAGMRRQLLKQAADGAALAPLAALHFAPPRLGFPITVVYPQLHASQEASELKLVPVRQQLHQLLGLPDNVPMLKAGNALAWGVAAGAAAAAAPGRSLRLRNVHEALAPPAIGGSVSLVDGSYEYYHYMQDRFNDNGWGCAYRSLQTIVSWFRLQGYTGKAVPTHRQIQEVLVALGDKDRSFVGSSQWIGAIELGYILDEYLGITSKVITVNRGSEIPGHARALAQHFATQGTPVMIGGGVLAYTLLGVAFDEDTGEAAFLILDPHYTGGEDLKKITAGTWVAWKQMGDTAAAGGPLFVKDAFYNFLCPQRPRSV